jgi:DNA-binding MarR family transcriptional regulator
MPTRTPTKLDPALIASELRDVLGRLVRRLRVQNSFPLAHGAVLGRLDRGGAQSVSDLAQAERVRPQSMAQTVGDLEADGLVERRADLEDRRRALVSLTDRGRVVLEEDRGRRRGWLAEGIVEDLTPEEQSTLRDAVALLRRLADR